jgi:hypothetical protein
VTANEPASPVYESFSHWIISPSINLSILKISLSEFFALHLLAEGKQDGLKLASALQQAAQKKSQKLRGACGSSSPRRGRIETGTLV